MEWNLILSGGGRHTQKCEYCIPRNAAGHVHIRVRAVSIICLIFSVLPRGIIMLLVEISGCLLDMEEGNCILPRISSNI